MSKIGDHLRNLAEEADSWPDLTAYAVVVTKSTALRAFCEFVQDEDEARGHAVRLLVNLVRSDEPSALELGAALRSMGDGPY